MNKTFLDFAAFLAKKAYGQTSPNPMVGAVLVHNDRIIGQGWHEEYGAPHAEVNCINSVKEFDKKLISESTLYVTLEPCSHHGKTPPCTQLIIDSGIKKVVVGKVDDSEKVNGKGIQLLIDNGVDVLVVQHELSRNLNPHFECFHKNNRPFITLKWAQTLDGYIGSGDVNRLLISKTLTQIWVHWMRYGYQSILVGANTIINDDPVLDLRKLYQKDHLIKLIWDEEGVLNAGYKIFNNNKCPVIIFTRSHHLGDLFHSLDHVEVVLVENDFIEKTLKVCSEKHIISLLVEGGSHVLSSFINRKLFDKIIRIESDVIYEHATVKAPALPNCIKLVETFSWQHDTIKIFNQ